jgi:hypothetical protein
MNNEQVRICNFNINLILLHHLQNILITFPPDATAIHLCVCKVKGWAKVGLQLFVWKKDMQVIFIIIALLLIIIIIIIKRQIQKIIQ